MNIEDSQNDVVRRRKLGEDVNALQSNVINANKNLVKLQVNQDTNYWHLKEKYDQVKGERERLQQNMLQLQMQLEALSSENQQERRLRAETVNKLDTTRKLCDELERLVQQSKEDYVKTKADQKALCDAYQIADKVVQKLEQDHLSLKEKSKQRIRELEGKITQMTAQLSQMSAVYSESQQRADAELSELRSQLREARVAERELAVATTKLGAVKAELEQCEAKNLDNQREMRNMLNMINNQLAEAKNILIQKDNELKKANEEIESIRKALSNQEQFTKMQCEHNSELQEKLALLEEEHQKDIAAVDAYKIKVEEVNSMCQTLNSKIAKLKEENDSLTEELNEKQENLRFYDEELELVKQQLLGNDTDLEKVTLELNNIKEESQKKTKKIEKLETDNEILVMKNLEVETAFTNHREAVQKDLKVQATVIEELIKEQDLKNSIINKEREERVKLGQELQAQALTLKETSHELELKTEALNQANIELQSTKDERDTLVTELQNKTIYNKEEYEKLQKQLQELAATIGEKNMELEVNISNLAQEKELRAKSESALRKLLRDWKCESDSAKEREKNLKEKVSELETDLRDKDEKFSREMTNFVQRRNQFEKEKCTLQDNINGLEQRINNMMKDMRRDPTRWAPEPDEDAIMALTPGHELPAQFADALEDSLFDCILSEPRADDPHEEPQPASRGEALPPAAPPASKRPRAGTPVPAVRPMSDRKNVSPAFRHERPAQSSGSFHDSLFDCISSEPSADDSHQDPQPASRGEALLLAAPPVSKRPRAGTPVPAVRALSDRENVAPVSHREPRYFAFASRGEALPPAAPPVNRRPRAGTPVPAVRPMSDRKNVSPVDTLAVPETKNKSYRFFKSRGNPRKI